MVIAVVVLLCENPGAGATRSLSENTSGENPVMMSHAVQGETQDGPVGESLKSHRRISSTDPGVPPHHAKPCVAHLDDNGQDIFICPP